jgi:hypothetical protein
MVFSIVLAAGLLSLLTACASSPARPAQAQSPSRPSQQAASPGSSRSHPRLHRSVSHPRRTSQRARPSRSSASASAWSGQFTGYGSSSWHDSWGYLSQGSFGQGQLTELTDRSAPGNGSVLRVKYGQGSSANSCHNCPNPGGAQFYTAFAQLGRPELAAAKVLYLRYYVKFQSGFDFGRGGKLPGLYGGPVGQESGGHHGQAFSTRYMWRDHPVAGSLSNCSRLVPCSQVYTYSPLIGSGYGGNVGGGWNWQGDGRWHLVEQEVDRRTGSVAVWYDGKRLLSASGAVAGISGIPFSGVFFSTFFGGHDSSWGPSRTEYAYFAGFAVSTSYIGP